MPNDQNNQSDLYDIEISRIKESNQSKAAGKLKSNETYTHSPICACWLITTTPVC
jgi:hypothetical protein